MLRSSHEYQERDLSVDTTPRFPTIKRSFSWGKKARARKEQAQVTGALESEVIDISLAGEPNDRIGFVRHEVTGEVIISHAGAGTSGACVGDCVLRIGGIPLDAGGVQLDDDVYEPVDAARRLLRENQHHVAMTVERHTFRTETLTRHAALRGTSLDRLGLTLCVDAAGYVCVSQLEGVAAKSKRIAVGDRLLCINGERVADLPTAVDLLLGEANELALVLTYGFLPPEDCEYDAQTGLFVPRRASIGTAVRRSLSFGKKKRPSVASGGGSTPRASTADAEASTPRRSVPELDVSPRRLTIHKNEHGKILVSFRAHAITGELIVSLVAEDGPAAQAGVEVGDLVVSMQGVDMREKRFEEAQASAMGALQSTTDLPSIDLLVRTAPRTEYIEFAARELGGPRNWLGFTFYTFDQDCAVRITKLDGPAAKSGRFALCDRIVSMNGIRVNHAQTLTDHIATAALTLDGITLEVAHGYSDGEGLWFGANFADLSNLPETQTQQWRRPKRSFSFGRKPRH